MLGIVRKLLKLAIVLLIANALYQFVPPYVHYIQFRDAVGETALFAKDVPDALLLDKVVALAEKNSVPLDRDAIVIRHDRANIYIDASYVQVITFVPTFPYAWQFEVKGEGLRNLPPGARDIR